MLTKSVALHCAKQGLDTRCYSIHPTFGDIPILDPRRDQFGKAEAETKLAWQFPSGQVGEPRDVISAVLYLAS